jgi:hypothetical protein
MEQPITYKKLQDDIAKLALQCLTLRDEIAIAAMAAMLAGFPTGTEQADLMARKAYRWADAMLKAREAE